MKGEVKPEGNGWYRVTQHLPHGSIENIRLPGFNGDSNIVALLGNPINKRAGWGIVTGKNATVYSRLNMNFFEVFFERRNFDVSVSPSDRVIQVTVSKNQSFDDSSLPKPQSYFTDNAVRQIGMVVQTSATAYSSPLGAALISNIERTQLAQKNGFIPGNVDSTLRGIEAAIEAMIDHILVGFASAQYFTGNSAFGRRNVPTITRYTAFKFGELPFLIANTAFNIILLFALYFKWRYRREMRNYGESNLGLLDRHPQSSNGATARQTNGDEPAER
ncbi:unnamed protein product [Clonostachys rosea]|uniref:DUF3533 domain-containing protein n=1 Tax=Bionectria ochroleuca TaxID=29856 RepID=A0ABY6UWD5_BIOOC|nr:unnamed protein product [Clonostachys rosea]